MGDGVSAGHEYVCGSGFVSSVVCGMKGVGGVCAMCICLARSCVRG